MRETKLRFTVPLIKSLSCPKNKTRGHYFDTKVSGLELQVTKAGTKTFYLRKWSREHHRAVVVRLGGFPDLSIEQARKLASEKSLQIIKGKDLSAVRRKKLNEPSLNEVLSEYIEFSRNAGRKEKTLSEYSNLHERYFKSFSSRKISSINKQELMSLQAKICNRNGKGTGKANRVSSSNAAIRFIKAVLNFAVQQGWIKENPAIGIKLYQNKSRDSYLDEQQLKSFLNACYQEIENSLIQGQESSVEDFLLISLFTGIRRNNILSMEWEQLDLKKKQWIIPDTKNNEAQKVFLSEPIMEVLRRRKSYSGEGRFVFPSNSKSGHLQEPKYAFHQILETAKIPKNTFDEKGMNIHALKHTFVTYCGEAGLKPAVFIKLAGHKLPGATHIYSHITDSSLREGYNLVASHMLSVAKVKKVNPKLQRVK